MLTAKQEIIVRLLESLNSGRAGYDGSNDYVRRAEAQYYKLVELGIIEDPSITEYMSKEAQKEEKIHIREAVEKDLINVLNYHTPRVALDYDSLEVYYKHYGQDSMYDLWKSTEALGALTNKCEIRDKKATLLYNYMKL